MINDNLTVSGEPLSLVILRKFKPLEYLDIKISERSD